ncbi:MAG: aspartyl-tRNA amidotransferase [Dehalococcoidia bacterium]|nr:aspartyl-tRNA amidotransferase [Dehalococcoidia bacterium]
MGLKEQLSVDLKDAMRNKDSVRRTLLRTLIAEVRNTEINTQTELDETGIIDVLTKQSQQRKDSAEAFKLADRQDLVDVELAEMEIISKYLPEQLTEEEIVLLIDEIINDVRPSGPEDMGKIMGPLMPKIRGRADGKIVSGIVSSKLRNL